MFSCCLSVCHFVQTLAEVLKVNSTLMILNLESNRITRKGIKVRNIVGVWESGRGVWVCVGVVVGRSLLLL